MPLVVNDYPHRPLFLCWITSVTWQTVAPTLHPQHLSLCWDWYELLMSVIMMATDAMEPCNRRQYIALNYHAASIMTTFGFTWIISCNKHIEFKCEAIQTMCLREDLTQWPGRDMAVIFNISFSNTSCSFICWALHAELPRMWMTQNPISNKPPVVQVMHWWRRESHDRHQYWPGSMKSYGVTKGKSTLDQLIILAHQKSISKHCVTNVPDWWSLSQRGIYAHIVYLPLLKFHHFEKFGSLSID